MKKQNLSPRKEASVLATKTSIQKFWCGWLRQILSLHFEKVKEEDQYFDRSSSTPKEKEKDGFSCS